MRRPPRPGPVIGPLVLGGALCAAAGPGAAHAGLAAAAGTILEAAPFLLAAELLGGRARALVALAGCGCGGRVPGALALPAIAVCWLAFGPLVALARVVAGLALLARAGRARADAVHDPAGGGLFGDLAELGAAAAVATVVAAGLGAHDAALTGSAAGRVAGFFLGLVLGAVVPCATAGVAIAAALQHAVPSAAAGALASAGLLTLRHALGPVRRALRRSGVVERCSETAMRRPEPARPRAGPTRLALAACLALLAIRGPAGFVNPRLLPIVGLGAALAVRTSRRPSSPGAVGIPVLLAVASAAGSPVPVTVAEATQLDAAYAGERLAFVGVARSHGSHATVERYAISCCRADASLVSVRTAGPLPVRDGTWLRIDGTLEAEPGGLAERVSSWRRIAPPSDPFIYR